MKLTTLETLKRLLAQADAAELKLYTDDGTFKCEMISTAWMGEDVNTVAEFYIGGLDDSETYRLDTEIAEDGGFDSDGTFVAKGVRILFKKSTTMFPAEVAD